MPDRPPKTVTEGTSSAIVGNVRQYKGGPTIGSGSISVATLELNDINGTAIAAPYDISADIDVNGALDTLISGANNAFIDDSSNTEIHVATFRITGTSGDAKQVDLIHEVHIEIGTARFEISE